ncbi:polysaccharide deacetylase family protein [bacterium]|nr:polysaccharide deacetylase family protein [bacterium]
MKNFKILILILITIIIGSIVIYIQTPKVSVLMYHDVFNKNELPENVVDKKGRIVDNCIITTENFKKQMKFLKENNYHTLNLDEFYDFVVNGAKIPKKSVLITFDDGRKSNIVNAYPILKENNQHAVIFLITSKIPTKTSKFDSKKFQHMSFDEINKSKDVFEFASHTHNMHKRENDTNKAFLLSKSNDAIRKDLIKSLEYVDKPYFAYPFGSHDKKLFSVLEESGFKLAFTTRKGKIRKGHYPYKINRYGIKEKYSINKFKRIVGN